MGHLEAGAGGASPELLAAGWVLGRYQIVRLLSVGGMAEIYLARAAGIAGFEKRVVIKRMLPQFAANQAFVDMFLGEARLAATLDHPNITQVYDIGEATGDYYYAMEYVPGVDLRAILHEERRHGRMVPIAIAVAIGRGMCAGLDHAHSRVGPDGALLGIVHRDVSPSNILVSYDGSVKVTDFGVAKVAVQGAKTRTGMLKGKLGYMAPEHVCSEPLDRRSDVFCIGIVLWELLAGRRLFGGDAEFAVLQRVVHDAVPAPSTIRSDVPPALEAVVMRALYRERELRFQTARDMQRELESFARDARLATSDLEVGEYMRRLFPPESARAATIEEPLGDEELLLELGPADPGRPTRAARMLAAPHPAGASADGGWLPTRRGLALLVIAASLVVGATTMLINRTDEPPGEGSGSWSTAVPSEGAPSSSLPGGPAPAVVSIAPAAEIAPAPLAMPLAEAPPARPAASVTPLRRSPPSRAAPARSGPARGAPSRRSAAPPAPSESRTAVALRDLETIPAPSEPEERPVAAPVDAPVAAPLVPLDIPVARRAPSPVAPPRPGSLDATPSIRRVDVRGSLQGSVVRRSVERALDRYRACYRTAARSAVRTPAAQLRLSFEIDESGMVRNVSASGAPLPGLGGCVEAATARLRSRITPDVGIAHAVVVIAFDPVGP